MQGATYDNQEIVNRFFTALQYLIDSREIRGIQTFTSRYNINRRNFNKLQKDTDRKIFRAYWLTFLVKDYGISAHWL